MDLESIARSRAPRARRDYDSEEVQDPDMKQPALGADSLVSISAPPEWAHEGFFSIRSLNLVISKVSYTAFGMDEPTLLCAPLGTGKVYRRRARQCLVSLTYS